MSNERRTHARRVLYSPEYLDMGADNGGVVVNLSEGGLAFQAVGPVVPEIDIPLSFSLGPGYRIDVSARVVWVSPEGKLGGAVFGKLSKDSRSLIREWLAKPDMEHDGEGGFVAPVPEQAAEGRPIESAPTVKPLTSAVAMQEADAMPVKEAAPAIDSVLPPPDVNLVAEPSPPASFVQPGITAPPIPVSEAIALEPVVPPPPARSPAVPEPVAAKQQDAPAAPAVEKQPVTPPPLQSPGPNRERSSAASYSVAPSISAWSRNDSPAAASAAPATRSAGPPFPPRSAENIFARSSQTEPERQGRGSRVLLVFAIVIAVGAIIAFYARTHRQQIGNEITSIGNTIAGTPAAASTTAATQTNSAAANPAANSSPNVNAPTLPSKPAQTPPPVVSQAPAGSTTPQQSANQGATSVPNAPKSAATHNNRLSAGATKAQVPTKGQTAANPSKGTSSSTSATPPLFGQAEYQRAENYLNGKGVPQDSAQAAEWFWRSLEAGNTSAAVPLADLYLAGNGVSRSCTQARILLDAAAQKNNAIAIKKLSELPESCQ